MTILYYYYCCFAVAAAATVDSKLRAGTTHLKLHYFILYSQSKWQSSDLHTVVYIIILCRLSGRCRTPLVHHHVILL